jgi:hypothetical protein
MERTPNNNSKLRDSEQGFITREEIGVEKDEIFEEVESGGDSEVSEDGGEGVEEEQKEAGIEVVASENLSRVAEQASKLEALMKDRESRSLSKRFMSSAQAEAFSHLFAMATEALKAGDIEDFKLEMLNIGTCFDGYGTDQSSSVKEDLQSLRGIGQEFALLRKNFDMACGVLINIPGIDGQHLTKVQAHFARIDSFHGKLYQAARSYLR